jgi:small subunit ribosomal protein S6
MFVAEYETTVILRPELTTERVEEELNRIRTPITKHAGKVISIKHWGRKKLAYEIEKLHRGIYVTVKYVGAGDLASDIERQLRLSERVMRFLTVKTQNKVAVDSVATESYQSYDYSAFAPEEPEAKRSFSRQERVEDDEDFDDSQDADDGMDENSAESVEL